MTSNDHYQLILLKMRLPAHEYFLLDSILGTHTNSLGLSQRKALIAEGKKNPKVSQLQSGFPSKAPSYGYDILYYDPSDPITPTGGMNRMNE